MMKVAIIDDEPDICFILSLELKASGFEAITFESAFAAKTYLEDNNVDAIICDFLMPKMNGIDLFNWVRSQGKMIPFIILTGEPMMDTQELLCHGVFDVLFKPQDLKKIIFILNKVNDTQKS